MESWLIKLTIVVILTTIAKFSGFSGYSKVWLLERLVTTSNGTLWLITHYYSSDSYRTLEKPILLIKWYTRNPLHFYSDFECP